MPKSSLLLAVTIASLSGFAMAQDEKVLIAPAPDVLANQIAHRTGNDGLVGHMHFTMTNKRGGLGFSQRGNHFL